eukprot:PhF_6_TR13020/c0_g1_i1/m.20636/K09478/ACADSB; short/branched chain acyl-CoA dehydrogenase
MRSLRQFILPRAHSPMWAMTSRYASTSVGPCTTLTEEEEELAKTVRDFSRNEIKPLVGKMDKEGVMDPKLIQKCFTQGLMGIETPTELQGAGMSFFSSILVIEELAKIDPSVSVMVDVQNTLVNNAFFRWGSADLKAKYLPRLATECLGSFCLSESTSGSDAFALKTRAEKKGNDYVINGTKMWITNAGEAEIFLVMANVDPSKGYRGITCFVVDKKAHPGVRVGKKEDKLGIRASSTCEINFENVVVPASNILGEEGKGYKIAIEVLNEGRIGIASQMLGIAEGAMDACIPYLFQRKQFNTRIGDFQGMQFQYAQAEVDIHAAKLMVYNAARKKCAGEDFVKDAAMAKLYASQVAERVSSKAVEWMGGVGFIKDFPVEKFYRDSKIGAIYEGTSNIQLHTIAKFVAEKYGEKAK